MLRVLKIGLGIIATLLILVVVAVLILAGTDYGRGRARAIALDALRDAVKGEVEVGRIEGNLLTRFSLVDVQLNDEQGRPFLSAERVVGRIALGPLLSQQVVIPELRLVRPVVHLVKSTDGEWNFSRIFATTDTAPTDTTIGWGDFIDLRDIAIENGRLVVRQPWPSQEPGAGGDSAAEARWRIERGPEGVQQVMEFRSIDGQMPRFVIAHPDSSVMTLRIDRLSMDAAPFRPPTLAIRDFTGDVRIGEDSLELRDVDLRLPDTRVTGRMTLLLESGDIHAALRAHALALADVQALYPPLPDDGRASFVLDFARPDTSVFDVAVRDLRLEIDGARLEGHVGAVIRPDSLTMRESEVAFRGVTTALIEQLVPGTRIPVQGNLTGQVTVAGSPQGLRVNSTATFDAPEHDPVRVTANGIVGMGQGITARDLVVRMHDAPVSLVREVSPGFPLGGTVNLDATVNGSTTGALTSDFVVTHALHGTRSLVRGRGTVSPADSMRMDVELRFAPVSLEVAQAFAGETDLRGELTGTGRIRGTPQRFDAQLDLRHLASDTTPADTVGTGRIEAHGEVDLADEVPAYQATVQMRGVDLHAVAPTLPATALTGVTTIDGLGTDPATMRARVVAELRNVVVDSTEFLGVLALATIRDGLLVLDTLSTSATFGSVSAGGAFGLTANREGTLEYRVDVTALNGLQRWLGTVDTTAIPARPGVRDRLARVIARADSMRLAHFVDTADIATIMAQGPAALRRGRSQVPDIPPLPRDSLAGEISARGRLAGGVRRFSLRGEARLSGVVAGGNEFGRGTVQFAWTDARTPNAVIAAEVGVDSLRAAGFALDSTRISARHRGDSGNVHLTVFPGDSAAYRVRAEYVSRPDEGEVRLQDLMLRFDSATWVAPHPSAIRWRGGSVQVDSLELRTEPGPGVQRGRILVHGDLPAGEPGRLDVLIDSLRLAPWLTMLQSNIPANGLANVRARLEGTRASPRLEGEISLAHFVYNLQSIPDVQARVVYRDRALRVDGDFRQRSGYQLARFEGSLPIDLSFADSVPNRLIEAPLAFDLSGDSIPLAPVSQVSEAIGVVTGNARGAVRIRGTWERPRFEGAITLDVPRMEIMEGGMPLVNAGAHIRMDGNRVVIDSVVAWSDGPIRGSGTVDITDLARPVFDMRLDTDDARIVAGQYGELYVDSRLGVTGPLDTLRVGGTIVITRGVILIPDPEELNLINTGDPVIFAVVDTAAAEELGIAPSASPFTNALIDVDVTVARGTWARSREANIEVYGEIGVERDTAGSDVAIDGALYTDQGDYQLYGRRFTVTRGSVVFTGDPTLNPVLQILARYEVRQAGRAPFDILITIGGTMQEPNVSLYSSAQPALTQSDLISFLAFGRSSSSLLQFEGSGLVGGGASGSSLAGNVAALATRQLAGVALGALAAEVQSDLVEVTGADVVDIRPADLPPDLSLGAFAAVARGTEIRLGKYVDRRTFVSVQVRPTLAVPGALFERRLGPQLQFRGSLETRYLPEQPSLTRGLIPDQIQVLGALLRWTRSW